MATDTDPKSATLSSTAAQSNTSARRASASSASGSRRQSETWDAAKVPPSQFQLDKGSIFSTPNSKDGNVERGDRDKKYFDKLKEKGWLEK